MGIKSLECNFNPLRKTYNPHLHLIVPNMASAELIVSEWLETSKSKWTNRLGQKIDLIYNKEKILLEIIKYSSKVFTEPDPNRRSKYKEKASHKVYAKALYNILVAMKGHRLFDRFGFNLPSCTKNKIKEHWTTKYEEWHYNSFIHDWFSKESGEVLSNYRPSKELLSLIENDINNEIE